MLPLIENLIEPCQKLLERIPHPAWIVNSTGQIYVANTALSAHIGRSLVGDESILFWELVPEAERDKFKKQWQIYSASISARPWQSHNRLENISGDCSLYTLEGELLSCNRNSNYSLFVITATPITATEVLSTLKPRLQAKRISA